MSIRNLTPEEKLGENYIKHEVFKKLDSYINFYESLSFGIMNWLSGATLSFINIDTYAYSSIQGTLESIKIILQKGRINDSYALLRKYFDVTLINVYTNLYIKNNHSIDNIVVGQINNWVKGKETIPEYRIISKYIKEDDSLRSVTSLLQKDNRYKEIRDRCNDHTHYNFYHNLLDNDNEIYLKDRIEKLDVLLKDLNNIFVQHFAYIFTINEHYLMSSDYSDYMDVGMTPPDDCQYWVAPSIQEIFDKEIKLLRPDIAEVMKSETAMELE